MAFGISPPSNYNYILQWLSFIYQWIRSRIGIVTVTAAYTVPSNIFYVRADVSAGGFQVTLPAAKNQDGRQICIKKIDSSANTLTIGRTGSDTLDGATQVTTTIQYDTYTFISNGNIIWEVLAKSVGNHEVVVHTGNGHGSTNTMIRRFTTTLTSVGTAITYADSAANGASFTVNETGLYEIFYKDYGTAAGVNAGISVNSAQLTTAVQSITIATLLGFSRTMAVGGEAPTSLTRVVRLTAADVIRPHTDSNPNSSTAATSYFSIRKVGT